MAGREPRLEQYVSVRGALPPRRGTGPLEAGIAQMEHIQRVRPTVMWTKFEALKQGAQRASDELWGRKKS